MKEIRQRFIVIEGPIGVGKTTLCRRLARTLDAELLLEQAQDNPFLPKFYEDPQSAALPAQLFFLFQRVEQVRALYQADLFTRRRVADFMLAKDPLFARLTLNERSLRLYRQAYDLLSPQAPVPDLVIYLQAPVDVLLERIAKRGISYEQVITAEYLERLSESYQEFFNGYDATPLLIVDASAIDLAQGEAEYQALLAQIARIDSGRCYFSATPELFAEATGRP